MKFFKNKEQQEFMPESDWNATAGGHYLACDSTYKKFIIIQGYKMYSIPFIERLDQGHLHPNTIQRYL